MISAKTKKTTIKIVSYIVKLAIGLAFIAPLIIGLMFSIHSEKELSQLPLLLFPKVPTLENYNEPPRRKQRGISHGLKSSSIWLEYSCVYSSCLP